MTKYAYLLKIDADANNNKYYEMTGDSTNDTFTVKFGRVGVTPQTFTYPMRLWNGKLQEKVKKGYKDVTHLKVEDSTSTVIDYDASIMPFITKLVRASQQSFASSYTVSASAITPQMIVEARNIINQIMTGINNKSLEEVNKAYIQLWYVIPRVMQNVKSKLPVTLEEAAQLLQSETETLDNAKIQERLKDDVLKNLGITLSLVTHTDDKKLLAMVDEHHRRIANIYAIQNQHKSRFDEYLQKAQDKTTRYLYHGTKLRNGLPILSNGLKILGNKSVTYSGSMLGDAIYHAEAFEKSYHYSDGLMLINQVHVGNQYRLTQLDEWKLHTQYDSIYAPKGLETGWTRLQNSEITVYNEAQVNLQYVLELK